VGGFVPASSVSYYTTLFLFSKALLTRGGAGVLVVAVWFAAAGEMAGGAGRGGAGRLG